MPPGGRVRAVLLHIRVRRLPAQQLGDAQLGSAGGAGSAGAVAAVHLPLRAVRATCLSASFVACGVANVVVPGSHAAAAFMSFKSFRSDVFHLVLGITDVFVV